MEQEENPSIKKILEFTVDKKSVTYDEIAALVGQDFLNSPQMETVLQILANSNIEIREAGLDAEEEPEAENPVEDDEDSDEGILEDEGEDSETVDEDAAKIPDDKTRLVNSNKESNVDDPIRLYLREIGKENLLTAEQEVILSKKMEDGNNIIKDVILNSGIMMNSLPSPRKRSQG